MIDFMTIEIKVITIFENVEFILLQYGLHLIKVSKVFYSPHAYLTPT